MPYPARYKLQPYNGAKKRHVCPQCNKPGEFTRYVDTRTDELLPARYGCCNRADKCGYHAGPYQIEADGLSYKERVYRQGREAGKSAPGRTRRPVPAPRPAAPPLCIPDELFTASLAGYDRNQFARLLREHFGVGDANQLLKQFHIGTSDFWPGACVFWYIDERGRVRGGQVVLFDKTGHTVKEPRRCTSWVHTALSERCRRRKEAPPAWLVDYNENGQKSPCLFGLPQLEAAPFDRPIAIVEAPKTAVFCTPYFPGFTWLAVGALSYLNAERLTSLRGRKIRLFPDTSAGGTTFKKWQLKAAELREIGFIIEVDGYLEQIASEEQRAAGIDLADILLDNYRGYPPCFDRAGSGTD